MFSLRGAASGIRALRRALNRLSDRIPLLRQARIDRIRQSPLFDAGFYAERNPDVVAAGVDLAKHYALSGWKEYRNPSVEFSTRRYLEANSDVAAAGINPLLHYIDLGQAEGRQIYPVEEEAQIEVIRASGLFDADYYLATYTDIQPPPQDPIRHYCEFGWLEGRNPSAEFDTQGYLEAYADVRDWGVNPFWHYVVAGRTEFRHANPERERKRIKTEVAAIRNSGLFDADYYFATYPDIHPLMDPIHHYCEHGWREGRNPSAEFDTQGYLEAYRDIKDWGANPFWHYVVAGRHEPRYANPDRGKYIEAEVAAILVSGLFDADYYLATNPDLQPPPQDPLRHYCERGWHEGRNPSAEFDTQAYLEAYADIKDAGMNPFWHYVVSGRAELRHVLPEQERKRIEAEVEVIRDSGLFDANYYNPPYSPIHHFCGFPLRQLYIHTCKTDAWGRKPMPGFHPGVYRDLHGVCNERANPFADYIRAGLPEGPWKLPVIRNTDACQKVAGNPRIALHLHVFYEDLLDEIIERLLANHIRPDLFVSIPEEKSVEKCKRYFVNYPGQEVAIEAVPNRGRDIGPFLTAFGSRIAENYDFVGHLHTKKTPHTNREWGENWRTFLLENLLGSQSNRMMDRILGFMSNTPTIGMVFPDDPNMLGWYKNKPFAEELAERLGITTEFPENFSFPVGTMFWARVDALRRFWALGLEWEDYPEEPLPGDGTMLHALERLFSLGLEPGLNQCAVTHVAGVTR